jgi:hypothetical protein
LSQRPEILQHPRLPMPLHGLNPRTIRGNEWWDQQRRAAYAANQYCCFACGVPAAQAKYESRLEAHEAYHIDYRGHRAEMIEIVALCHACHNFIHNGRLYNMLGSREISAEMFIDIMQHGFSVLKAGRLKPHVHAVEACQDGFKLIQQRGGILPAWQADLEAWHARAIKAKKESGWDTWRLVIDGVEYAPLFKTEQEWIDHYSK